MSRMNLLTIRRLRGRRRCTKSQVEKLRRVNPFSLFDALRGPIRIGRYFVGAELLWKRATRELRRTLDPALRALRPVIGRWQRKYQMIGASDTASTESIMHYIYQGLYKPKRRKAA